MAQKRKTSAPEKFVVVTAQPRPWRLALASFAAGAGFMWLVLRLFTSAPAPQTAVASSGPPDVSKLPPAQAAATLGHWEYDRANWAAAIQHYERAIASGLDTPDVRTDLGTAYRYLDDGDKALEQYAVAQRKDPFHQNSLFNTAVVYSQVKRDPTRALATAREFLRRFPQSEGAIAARQMIAELEAERTAVEKKLGNFLSTPAPAKSPP